MADTLKKEKERKASNNSTQCAVGSVLLMFSYEKWNFNRNKKHDAKEGKKHFAFEVTWYLSQLCQMHFEWELGK